MKHRIVLILLLFALFNNVPGIAQSEEKSANQPVSLSFAAGGKDSDGNFLGGTEVMNLVPFQGKLYAGIGYWTDRPQLFPNHLDPKSGAQVLVLSGKKSGWRLEKAFSNKDATGKFEHMRLSSMSVIQFHQFDQNGKITKLLDQMLIVSLDGGKGGVFCQTSPGIWKDTKLPGTIPVRSIAVHYDAQAKVEKIFAGAGGGPDANVDHVIFTGVYDRTLPGKIRWSETKERTNLQSRVMSIADCNGQLFAAAKPSIFKRDDKTGTWNPIYTYPARPYDLSKYCSGFRALTSVKNAGGASRLLTAFEGINGDILEINPEDGSSKLELCTRDFLEKNWLCPVDNRGIIAAYNDIPIAENKPFELRLIGLNCRSRNQLDANCAWILSRAATTPPEYALHKINSLAWPNNRSDQALWSIRSIAVSPFPEDRGQVVYMGGYDGHFKPNHNTAWIYRVGLKTLMQPYVNRSPRPTQ